MKKKLVLFLILLLSFNVFSQDAQNTTVVQKDPLRKYLRPSISVLYIDRGEDMSKRLIDQLVLNGISGKFNVNDVVNNVITLKKDEQINDSILGDFLTKNYTNEILKVWFPYDNVAGMYSTKVIEERGIFNANDADVVAANASQRGQAMLKDAGLALIERSFILVYDLQGIGYGKNEKTEAYTVNCAAYLYQLDWSEEIENKFYSGWNSPTTINDIVIKAKFLGKVPSKLCSTSQPVNSILSVDDSKFFKIFSKNITSTLDISLTKLNEDFQVKAPIAKTSPIQVKVGKKEGVKIDQRYYVFEIELDELGNKVEKRKGVIRATAKIAKNDTISTGDSQMTTFYQTHGAKLYEGMLIKQKPDLGLGVYASFGNDFNVGFEANLLMWGSKFLPALDDISVLPYGTKVYFKYTIPMGEMLYDGVTSIVDSNTGDQLHFNMFGFGLSKDFYFGRIFSITPYIGLASLQSGDYEESLANNGYTGTSGIDAGLNYGMALLHNFQIVANTGFNSVRGKWYSSPISLSVGLRYQF